MSRSRRPKCKRGRCCWVCSMGVIDKRKRREEDRVRAEILDEAAGRFDWTVAALMADDQFEMSLWLGAIGAICYAAEEF